MQIVSISNICDCMAIIIITIIMFSPELCSKTESNKGDVSGVLAPGTKTNRRFIDSLSYHY